MTKQIESGINILILLKLIIGGKRNNIDVNNLWSDLKKIKEPYVRLNVDENYGTSLPENYQSQEDYNFLFNDFNEEKLSDLIDDDTAQIFTSKIEWLPKPAPKELHEYFNNKCKVVVHGFESLHIYIQFIEQELKITTIFLLIHETFSLKVIDDKW
ncbi:hypothetical protein C2G38_2178592 [Gigaspora rosea]|uniref:Uncharacterized protein n=1 Tax=Gigaspora rosea TaxID=44941 RepID=A0A397VFT5_9GLOM|nr:hypothetical protein C2G38_2178592 [Gigaspora rosea]